MIYLKNLNGQIREYKDGDIKTVNTLIDTGRWVKVQGRKDLSLYTKTKKKTSKKKSSKKTSKKK